MLLYWSAHNSLPDDEPTLLRKVGAFTDEDKSSVLAVLEMLFPRNYEGLRCHFGLDKQLDDAREVNGRRSASMKASHQTRRGATLASREPDNPEDF